MGDLTAGFNDYGEFKATLGAELKANVEGFVRIGYLLKVARDTDILKESGHKNVAEFAAKEYGLTKDVVSRYIAINDRYSEGGYSDRLLAKFEGFGVSKLAEMLTLPDSIIDEITPTLTREEIKAIKAEVKAEEEISPIEIAIEAGAPENLKEERELSPDLRVWKAYFSGDNGKEKERFLNLDCAYYSNLVISDADVKEARTKFFDTFGGKILWARVPGVGRIMIAVSEEADDKITFTNSRSGEKKTFTGKDVIADIKELVEGDGCVEDVFNDLFVTAPKEEPKVAPVQQAAEDIMPKPGSWTYDQPKTKSVQTEVNKSQGDADNEKECSKETADNRMVGNENREKMEAADGSSDKKEEVVDAEYREAEEGKEDNDRSEENGEEGSRTENDNAVPAEVEQVTAEASGMANEKDLKDKISSIKDSADTISIICSELLVNSYDADNLDKILEAVSKMTEKVTGLTEEWRRIRESVADGDD